MDADPKSVEARLDELRRRVEELEARVGGGPPVLANREERRGPQEEPEGTWLVAGISLVGRTLMVLGGAFLLRYLTESHVLPRGLGTGLGVAYAILWLVVADLTRRTGGASSTFFGLSSALIAFPLFWETALKFHTLSPAWSAVAVTSYAAVGLFAAVLGRMHGAAVVTAGPAALTLAVLGFATGRPAPFLIGLGLLAFLSLALGLRLRWALLQASVAAIAHVTVLLLTVVYALRPDSPRLGGVTPVGVAIAQFSLLAMYLLGAALAILRRRTLGGLEILQLGGAFVLALGGVLLLHRVSALPPVSWGLLALSAGALAFGLAYGPLLDPGASRAAFATLSASGLLAMLAGLWLALPPVALAPVMAAAAVGLVWLASARPGRGLTTHATAYLIAAAVASELSLTVGRAFVSGFVGFAEFRTTGALLTTAATVVCCAFTVPVGAAPGRPRRTPIVPLLLAALIVGAMAISLLVGKTEARGEWAAVRSSVVRTAVLSLASVAAALGVRVRRLRGARRLLVPLLLAGGLKLAVQDVPAGRPAVLFGTLAVYGATLILAPRLQRASLRHSAEPRAAAT